LFSQKSEKLISGCSKKQEISKQNSKPRSAATDLSFCVTQSGDAHQIFPKSQPEL
jgi:hypothetical protein